MAVKIGGSTVCNCNYNCALYSQQKAEPLPSTDMLIAYLFRCFQAGLLGRHGLANFYFWYGGVRTDAIKANTETNTYQY